MVDRIPNLNWAGGTSRPRYFQIRGIGERSHYFGEGPPNFSVGFLLDNIDISGMGMVGQLFDINQVEVFKGPQSSVYGPNAIAGLITLFSKDPTNELDLKSSLTIGTDNQLGFATVLGNGITPRISYRLSGVFETSDGFRKNISRDIRNSNEIEEAMLRVKLKMVPTKNVSILSTLLFSQINNGYDVWSPDNNMSLKTYTDDPGKDSQDTYGLSINGDIVLNKHFKLKNIISMTNTKAYHSYDADWGDSTYWIRKLGDVYFPIRDYYEESKNRRSYSMESRVYLNKIVLGLYKKELQEKQDAAGNPVLLNIYNALNAQKVMYLITESASKRKTPESLPSNYFSTADDAGQFNDLIQEAEMRYERDQVVNRTKSKYGLETYDNWSNQNMLSSESEILNSINALRLCPIL